MRRVENFNETKLYKAAVKRFKESGVKNLIEEYQEDERFCKEDHTGTLEYFYNSVKDTYDWHTKGDWFYDSNTLIKEIVKLGIRTGLDIREDECNWLSYMSYLLSDIDSYGGEPVDPRWDIIC